MSSEMEWLESQGELGRLRKDNARLNSELEEANRTIAYNSEAFDKRDKMIRHLEEALSAALRLLELDDAKPRLLEAEKLLSEVRVNMHTTDVCEWLTKRDEFLKNI